MHWSVDHQSVVDPYPQPSIGRGLGLHVDDDFGQLADAHDGRNR